nr:integrase, catalytic region, zinc finger, CCHC-type, peptidase aspartic, catalytic [Tanacetum cinerariifolium]
MRGSKYGEQDRKAVILYEYKTFKVNEGEQLLDTYLRYLQVINNLKKCGYKKDNYKLNYKFLNNLQPEWKQYGTLMRQTKNLMDINIDALYNILKQNQGDVNDALGYKKKAVVIKSDPLALVAEKTNMSKQKEKVVVSSNSEGSGADDFSELKNITALLAKSFNRKKFYSKPTNNNLRTSSTSQSANKKQEFVKSDDKKEDKKADEKKRDISKVKCYNCKKEGHFAKDCKKVKVKDYNYYKTKMLLAKKDSDEQVLLVEDQAWMESNSDSDQEISANMVFMAHIEKEYYDNSTNCGLFVNNDDDQEIFHDAIESASEKFIENHIDSQKDYDKSEVDHNDSEGKEHFVNKLIQKFNHKIAKCQKRIEKTVHMIMPSKDILYNGRKGIGFENPRYFEKARDLRPSLYNQKVIGLGYTPMFLTHSDEALKIEKFKRSRENKIEFAYDYGNLNASYVNEKINFEDDYFQEIINPDFEKIDSPFQQTSSLKPETSSASVCNDAMNVSCNSKMCDVFDDNNFFIFDDESVRISPISKMPFRKKPCDSLNVRSKRCSKHMTGNRAPLTNFVEKFLGTVRFGNNDFAMIASYGDVVIGSMMIKKVYYVEGLGHNLFRVGQFCDKGLEVAFQ